jgi:glycosyltransferase involved in cell wall biosynthesis
MIPAVTVVVPAYGEVANVERAIRSLRHQTLPPSMFEVIVVDSFPSAAVQTLVASLGEQMPFAVECLRKRPEGPGPSRNAGARRGRAAILAFMDSDCEADPGWLKAGLAGFVDARVGLVQGRVMPDPKCPHQVFARSLSVEKESFIFESANVFYRREAFEAAGGFPADMAPTARRSMGGEDVILGWTVKRLGWLCRFENAALVYHAVIPATVWEWIVIKQLFGWPRMVKAVPELRAHLPLGYFYDRHQAYFTLGLLGSLLSVASPAAWALWLPYCASRSFESSATLRGPLRVLRALFYLPRDVASFFLLSAGSVWFRRVLL